MMRRPPVLHQGHTIFIAASVGAALTASFGTQPPVVVFYTIIFLFGVASGVLMSLGRTVVQEAAEPRLRARVLAIYSLGFLGSAPLGSFLVGQIAEVTGVLAAAVWGGAAMAVLLLAVGTFTPIWGITRDPTSEPKVFR